MSIRHTQYRHGRLVQVSGVIDETFDLRSAQEESSVVVFDLDEMTRVTSFGVREWMVGLKSLTADYYCFARCRPSIGLSTRARATLRSATAFVNHTGVMRVA